MDPMFGPRKENIEHGLEVRKIYEQKVTTDSIKVSGAYYSVVSNIGCRTRLRTTNTPGNTTVLRYCSRWVLTHIVIKCWKSPWCRFRSHNTYPNDSLILSSSFPTLHSRLPSWLSFTILSIVSMEFFCRRYVSFKIDFPNCLLVKNDSQL